MHAAKGLLMGGIFLLFGICQASDPSACGKLNEHIQLLKEAQAQIHASLVANHESFASVLEHYRDRMSQISTSDQPLFKANMSETAQSFRTRGLKAKKMVVTLQAETAEVIALASQCGKDQ